MRFNFLPLVYLNTYHLWATCVMPRTIYSVIVDVSKLEAVKRGGKLIVTLYDVESNIGVVVFEVTNIFNNIYLFI